MLKVPSHLVLPITVGLLCVCLAVLAFWLLGNKTSSIRRALGGEQLGTVMEKDREGHEVRKSSRSRKAVERWSPENLGTPTGMNPSTPSKRGPKTPSGARKLLQDAEEAVASSVGKRKPAASSTDSPAGRTRHATQA